MKTQGPDLETAILVLRRRVSKSDMEDWNVFKKVLLQRKNNIDDKIIVGARIHIYVYTCIDADYDAHKKYEVKLEVSYPWDMECCTKNYQCKG